MPDSKPSWSQGEWRADGLNVFAGSICIHTECKHCLPGYANADLIAAAPTLYGALVAARAAIAAIGADLSTAAPEAVNAQSYYDDIRRIDAALSKARGEG